MDEIVGAGYYSGDGSSQQQAHGQSNDAGINPYGIIEDHFQLKLDQNLSMLSVHRDTSQNRMPIQAEDENYIY